MNVTANAPVVSPESEEAEVAYRIHAVPLDLASRVEFIWTLETHAATPWTEYVWPRPQVDVIFVGGTAYSRSAGGSAQRIRTATVEAPGSIARRFEHGAENRLTGIRLRPGVLPFAEPHPSSGLLELDALGLHVGDVWHDPSSESRAGAAVDWTRTHVTTEGAGQQILRAAVSMPGIPEVAAALGVSERSLRRLTWRYFGVSPVELRCLLRFRRAARLLDGHYQRQGFSVVLDAGYADQAHFCRECRRWTGEPPSFWWPLADSFKRG